MKTASPKNPPLKNSSHSGEGKYPELMRQLKKVRSDYAKARGTEKEKLKAEFQKLSDEKKRLMGDANPPSD